MKKIKVLALFSILLATVIYAAGGIKTFTEDVVRFGSSVSGIRKISFDQKPDGSTASFTVDPTDDFVHVNRKFFADAGLDVTGAFAAISTSTGSIPCPKMTETQRNAIGSPSDGFCVYNTDTKALNVYNGSASTWVPVGSGAGGSRLNQLEDGSFEISASEDGGTCTTCTATREQTIIMSAPFNGYSLKASVSASVGAFYIDKAASSEFSGLQGVVSCWIKTDLTDVTFKSRGNGSDVDSVAVSSDSKWKEYIIPVVLNSTSNGYKVDVGSSQTGSVYIDECYVGTMPAGMMPEIAQPQVQYARYDTYAGHGSTNTRIPYFTNVVSSSSAEIVTVSNSSTLGFSITALKDCVVNIDLSYNASTAEFFGFSVNSTQLSTGISSITTAHRVTNATQSGSGSSTNASASVFLSAGDVLRPHSESGTGASTANRYHLNFTAVHYPPSNKIYANQDYFYLDTSIGGASFTHAASSTQVGITNASLDMVINPNSTATARIPCSTTVAASGLTCSSGSESLGINFVAPTSGVYEVCASFTANGGTATYRFVETGNSDQTIAQQGTGLAAWGGTNNVPIYWCDRFRLTQGEKTIRIFQESAATIQIEIDRSVNAYLRDLHLTVRKVNSQIVGTFKDVATSPNMGKPKVCHYAFGGAAATLASPVECTTGTCVEVFDSCGTGTPPTHAATALYSDLTFAAGTFAANTLTNCSCIAYDSSSGTSRKCSPYFITPDQTWSSGSSGEYVMNMVTHGIDGTQNTAFVLVRCEGVAP